MWLIAICRQKSGLAEGGITGSGREWVYFQSFFSLCSDRVISALL